MSSRSTNERRFKQWTETENGGRLYTRKVIGQYGWYAIYVKEVNANEDIIHFRQEIYNEQNKLRASLKTNLYKHINVSNL
jgi:hypothetical protein